MRRALFSIGQIVVCRLTVTMLIALFQTHAHAGRSAEDRSDTPTDRPSTDDVDDYIKTKMRRQHIPGLSLAVVRNGEVIKTRGYGLANLELNVPAASNTVYQIHSITKQFTATAVMMLVKDGRIGLDDKISKYLKGTPEAWKEITIRHLLTHTSGIKDFIDEPTSSLRLEMSDNEIFKAATNQPLNFSPGERFGYSNTGYHLLGMTIQQIAGKPYGDYLQQRIFDPLGMNDTRIINLAEIIPNRASGYSWSGGKFSNAEYVAVSLLACANGGIRSTVLDLAKWDAALYGEKLLGKSSLEQMWTPTKVKGGRPVSHGFGWSLGTMQDHRYVYHTGGHWTGFKTVITRFLDDRLTVVILTNQSGVNVEEIAEGVARRYIPALRPPRPPLSK